MKRSPMRRRSPRRARFQSLERVPLVAEMLAESPWCELGDRIWFVDRRWRSCGRWAIGLHELRKRSAGGSMTNRANLMRTCGPCNSWVEDHPDAAHRVGLVVWRGDPGWDTLGG